MKNILSVVIIILLFSLPMMAQGEWVVDKSHSKIGFSVKHMVISDVTGEFTDYSIKIKGNPAMLEKTSLQAKLSVSSINTRNEKRDGHLKSPDFFNAKEYPEIIFVSKKIQKVSNNQYKITGTLTIKGISKSIIFNAKMNGQIKDPWGNERMGWTIETKINRFDFDLKWNKLLESGGLVVGDEVKIILHLELIHK